MKLEKDLFDPPKINEHDIALLSVKFGDFLNVVFKFLFRMVVLMINNNFKNDKIPTVSQMFHEVFQKLNVQIEFLKNLFPTF